MLKSPRHRVLVASLLYGLAAIATACGSSPTTPDGELDLGDSVALEGGSTLVFQGAALLDAHRATIERVVRETVAVVRSLVPVDASTIIVRAGTDLVIPEIGIGGRADGGTVQLMFDPESAVLAASLERELFPLLAHELHHVARIRAVGYGNNLLGAMVSEGLADQFAVQVATSAPPLWSSALDEGQLVTWSERAREHWHDTAYDHDAWFFGGSGIPRWTGYSIGFALTADFLATHPQHTAASLFGEPAMSFVPPEQDGAFP